MEKMQLMEEEEEEEWYEMSVEGRDDRAGRLEGSGKFCPGDRH